MENLRTGNVLEVKMGEGVYFTDFRPGTDSTQVSNCITRVRTTAEYQVQQDPRILAEDYKEFQSKIGILRQSIEDITEEPGYTEDPDFTEAIGENLSNHPLVMLDLIVKYIKNQLIILDYLHTVDPQNSLLQTVKYSLKEDEYRLSQIKYKDFQYDQLNHTHPKEIQGEHEAEQNGVYL